MEIGEVCQYRRLSSKGPQILKGNCLDFLDTIGLRIHSSGEYEKIGPPVSSIIAPRVVREEKKTLEWH